MKSPLEAPEKQIAEETSAKPEKPVAAVIDTSKMAKGQREALELAEAARDPLEDRGSFASNLFIGRYDFHRIYPYPAARLESRCRRNMAGSVCRNAITDAPQFCLVVGMEMLQRLFLRISRSELRSRCSCLEQKSRNKNICRASQAGKFLRLH